MPPLASIVSAGMSRFGRREGLYWRELFLEAFKEVIDRCPNLDPKKDIKAIYLGMMSSEYERQGHTGATASTWAGLLPVEAIRTEAACASAGAAVRFGVAMVASGLHDVVLVGGVEKMTHRPTPEVTSFLATADDFHFDQWHGLTFPGFFALMAVAHFNRYGSNEEDLARIAVKNHRNGALNPKAHFQREITLEEALKSRVVAWPLKLYDCCPITDGASLLLITRPDIARRFTDTPVNIIGQGFACGSILAFEKDFEKVSFEANVEAARQAYLMAKVEPKDIDVAEIHDCFTIAELIEYEDLGFCRKGEGSNMIREGIVELGGKIPINTSGGLKCKGHPVGATGAAQLYEIYLQLTNQAGRRQVRGAEIGLAHNLGGPGASAVVTICSR
jgi:acetyl-CoA acetyltransferase